MGQDPFENKNKNLDVLEKPKTKIQFILGTCRTVYSGEILNWENPWCKTSGSEVIVQKMGFWNRLLREGAASTTGSCQDLEQTSVKDIWFAFRHVAGLDDASIIFTWLM